MPPGRGFPPVTPWQPAFKVEELAQCDTLIEAKAIPSPVPN